MNALLITATLIGPVLAAQQPERRTVAGEHVAIFNLAGVVRVERGGSADVEVELTRGGRDAAKLSVATGSLRGRETLRVMYPDDDIVYRELGHGSTTLHVRDDGTFNEHDGRHWFNDGRRVRISGSGNGLEAHADLRIAIPPGKQVDVYLAVGRVSVTNVEGDLRVDVASADVTADHVKGTLAIDTGSGDVHLSDAQGDVSLDTGSGNVTVSGMSGEQLKLDTGSGDVSADRVAADVLKIDTGSGDVTASSVRATDVNIDTGSGGVQLDLLSDLQSLNVDTGSGDVTVRIPAVFGATVDIETSNGGIDLQDVALKATRLEEDHVVGEIGDGKGRVKIETGSGGVRLIRSR